MEREDCLYHINLYNLNLLNILIEKKEIGSFDKDQFTSIKNYFETLPERDLNNSSAIKVTENTYHVKAPFNQVFTKERYVTAYLNSLENTIILAGEDSIAINGIRNDLHKKIENK